MALDISGAGEGFQWEPSRSGQVYIKALPGTEVPQTWPEGDPPDPRIVVQRYVDFFNKKIDKTFSLWFDIRNAGGQPLVITRCSIVDDVTHFSLPSSMSGRTISPKRSTLLLIYCHPRDPGERRATILIETNDPRFPRVTVFLKVNGVYDLAATSPPPETSVAPTP